MSASTPTRRLIQSVELETASFSPANASAKVVPAVHCCIGDRRRQFQRGDVRRVATKVCFELVQRPRVDLDYVA